VTELPDLRDHVRDEVMPSATVVVRGGPDTRAKLVASAERFRRAFVLDGEPVLGISVFAALDEIGACSLDGILAGKMSTYRVVHLVRLELVRRAFAVLPTFERPHMTLLLDDLEQVEPLLAILGEGQPNPRYGVGTRRTRRRPQ
jgi:hypothetical protein